MRNFILRRLLQTLPMLLLASFIIFLLFAKTPGDFIDGNITLTSARAAELKAIYGLDQPLLTRYLHWLGQLLRGDLGFSLQYQIPVSQLLNQYIWNSFSAGQRRAGLLLGHRPRRWAWFLPCAPGSPV